MNIERAFLKDAKEILALQKRAFKQEAERYGNPGIEPLSVTLEQTKEEFKNSVVLKMTKEGRIIGSVRADIKGKTCLVRKLIVEPELQNRGYGAALMKAIEAECKDCSRFELFTGHKSDNNRHLYKKLGYKITGTIKPYENDVCMVKMEKIKERE